MRSSSPVSSFSTEEIVQCVIDAFDRLPSRAKPRDRSPSAGRLEWVPLSGIVLQFQHSLPSSPSGTHLHHPALDSLSHPVVKGNNVIVCASIATGMKCLPQSVMASIKGRALHDSHAEVLAIRGFNKFLVDECTSVARGRPSWIVELLNQSDSDHTSGPHFQLRPGVQIFMYCSEAPCGDASMELIMKAQQDPTPWDLPGLSRGVVPAKEDINPPSLIDGALLGRGYFSQLGIVRRKPSRNDAPVAMSKSCSDKLALKQFTSLLSGPVSLVIDPATAYLDHIIFPQSVYVAAACDRAFGCTGRLSASVQAIREQTSIPKSHNSLRTRYRFHPFRVHTVPIEFQRSRRFVSDPSVLEAKEQTPQPHQQHPGPSRNFSGEASKLELPATNAHSFVACNISGFATGHLESKPEALINGILQGYRKHDPRGASAISRHRLCRSLLELKMLINPQKETLKSSTTLRSSSTSSTQAGQQDGHDATIKSPLSLSGLETYKQLKSHPHLSDRNRLVKLVRDLSLKNWQVNEEDRDWSLDLV